MKVRLLGLVLLLASLLGANKTEITVDTFPAEQEYKPGVVMVLVVEGLSEDVEYEWHQVPKLETDSIRKGKDDQNQPVLFFHGVVGGLRTFLLQEAREGLDPIARVEFEYGVGPVPPIPPIPPIPPDPPDPPDPPLPPPGHKWQVVIVYESDSLDNMPREQLVLIASLVFRENLKKAGHHLLPGGVIDVDRAGDVPDILVPFIGSSKGKTLPRLCIAPVGGGDISSLPLPANEDAVFKLLNERRQEVQP